MSDTISTPGSVSATPTDSPFVGMPGMENFSNGSTNQASGAFLSTGDGSRQFTPPDPFDNPSAYGLNITPNGQPSPNPFPQAQFPQMQNNPNPFPQGQIPQQQPIPGAPENNPEPFTIDPRYANLPKDEAAARTWQSMYDKKSHEYQQAVEQLQRLQQIEQSLSEILDDDQAFESFIAERRPDLIQPKDISQMIQTQLKKEFGEDFVPDETQMRIAGTKDWLYAKKAEGLYQKLSEKGEDRILPLKELRAKRAQERQQEEAQAQAAMNEVKAKMRWSDANIQQFKGWAQQLTPLDLAQLYTHLMGSLQMRTPSVVNHNGSPVAPQNPTQAWIDQMFGQ